MAAQGRLRPVVCTTIPVILLRNDGQLVPAPAGISADGARAQNVHARKPKGSMSLRLASAAAMSMDQIHQRTCMHSLCWHRLTDSPVSSLNFCFVQVLIGSLYE